MEVSLTVILLTEKEIIIKSFKLSGCATESYSGSSRFESTPKYKLYRVEYSSIYSVPPGKFQHIGHDRFLPNFIQFINHLSFHDSTLYSLDQCFSYCGPRTTSGSWRSAR
jgi:hypothetical protein